MTCRMGCLLSCRISPRPSTVGRLMPHPAQSHTDLMPLRCRHSHLRKCPMILSLEIMYPSCFHPELANRDVDYFCVSPYNRTIGIRYQRRLMAYNPRDTNMGKVTGAINRYFFADFSLYIRNFFLKIFETVIVQAVRIVFKSAVYSSPDIDNNLP